LEAPVNQLAILCLSHLGWDWVWQRPQQILTRLAAHYPVVYINEPRHRSSHIETALERVFCEPNLIALQLFSSTLADPGQWSSNQFALIRDYLLELGWLTNAEGATRTARPLIGWFYTPMPVGIIDYIPFNLVIYDAMDELANFKGAPAEIRQHEKRLFAEADLVFAGSPSLCEEKRKHFPLTHLFSSGVDVAHFGNALSGHVDSIPELNEMAHPIIGFYGVLDERLDLQLLDSIACLRPNWTWVMLGPVTKIDPQELPKRKNILYPGMKHYDELPSYLSAFDVAIMPFALNKVTIYLRPTKLLEFMAARKPIVSTPLHDVCAIGSPAVSVAATPEQFIAAIESALNETPEEKAARVNAQTELVLMNSWETIVENIRVLIDEALPQNL